MPGAKTDGWIFFDTAGGNFQDVQDSIVAGKFDQGAAIQSIAIGLQQTNAGIHRSLQELYERMQRLHQKIDRIEKKIGSV